MTTEAIIKMRQLGKVYSTGDMLTHALSGVDLDIHAGDYVSISGPSGCGKSTLLSLIGLLDFATAGKLLFCGQDVSSLSLGDAARLRNEKIGFVFQQFNLIDQLTVFDNIALPLRYAVQAIDNKQIQQKVDELLHLVGMSAKAKYSPCQLSGGQQQRIAIARALVANPEILLVDEPTGNLDSHNGEQIMSILGELNNRGTTLCLVTHDVRFAELAKRKVYLLDGRILSSTE